MHRAPNDLTPLWNLAVAVAKGTKPEGPFLRGLMALPARDRRRCIEGLLIASVRAAGDEELAEQLAALARAAVHHARTVDVGAQRRRQSEWRGFCDRDEVASKPANGTAFVLKQLLQQRGLVGGRHGLR